MMMYYAIINGEKIGPIEASRLLACGVTATTMVWCEGMPAWQQAGAVPQLAYLFAPQQPPTGFAGEQAFAPRPPMPKTWLAESIIATLLCCLPLGIVGIVYAAGVSTAYDVGNYAQAQESSRKAKLWTLASAGVCILGVLAYIAFLVVVAVAAGSAMDGYYYEFYNINSINL